MPIEFFTGLEDVGNGTTGTEHTGGEHTQDWTPTDTNGDGVITGNDIPFEPGSPAAKTAWGKIEALAKSPEAIAKAKALGHDNGYGMYNGKPLVPGAGEGQGDFDLLRDKLIYSNGYSPEVAVKIAAKAKWLRGG